MWRNYLTVGLRALSRNRVHAFINIFGLAVGLAGCLLLLLYVRYETRYDEWLPDLSPSAELVSWILGEPITPARWTTFTRRYRREMNEPVQRRLIALLAALSHQTDFSVGCYCEDESHCHRSVLRDLLTEADARLA